jgi:hypothetical protein
MIDRDPRQDPRTGDIVERISTTSGKPIRRIVVMRDGLQVFYKASEDGDILKSWVMTWREWCVDTEIVTSGNQVVE